MYMYMYKLLCVFLNVIVNKIHSFKRFVIVTLMQYLI